MSGARMSLRGGFGALHRLWPRGAGTVAAAAGASLATDATLRAAALLRGGVAAMRVWRVLGEEPAAAPELSRLAHALAAGETIPEALAGVGRGGGAHRGGEQRREGQPGGEQRGEPWRVLAVAWWLAERSGAPLAAVLERLAAAFASLERLGERRSVLLAGPRATIRLVAALPLVALLLGAALGFDPLPALLSPVGACATVAGLVLLVLGVRWASRLADALAAAEWVSGLECELCWVALSGGAAPGEALRRLATGIDRYGVRWARLSALCRAGPVPLVLSAAAALGTPAGPMLLAEAEASRARTLAGLEREAEKLAVRVLLPIGLCVLPAFMLLGVLPVLLAVLGSLGPLV